MNLVPPSLALSKRADLIPRSAIREIMALAAGRNDVIHLEVGEPDFGTPSHIIEGAFEAVRGGATRYTGNAGRPTLRAAIAARAARRGTSVAPERAIVTVGAIGALFTALMTVVDSGDEVLIPDPGWPNYEAIVVLTGGIPVRYPLPESNNFVPDPDDLLSRIGQSTKAILINSPGNPTGAVFPLDVVRRIGAIAAQTGAYLISDEIYEDIVFDDAHHEFLLEHTPEDRLFIISGVSKSYAMTGWRLGWLICPSHAIAIAEKLQEPVVSCAPTPSQVAAETALAGPQDFSGDGTTPVPEAARHIHERSQPDRHSGRPPARRVLWARQAWRPPSECARFCSQATNRGKRRGRSWRYFRRQHELV